MADDGVIDGPGVRGDIRAAANTSGARSRVPTGGVSAQSVDAQTRVASGCGKQAIYVESCSGNNHSDCTWILNSTVKPAAAPSN